MQASLSRKETISVSMLVRLFHRKRVNEEESYMTNEICHTSLTSIVVNFQILVLDERSTKLMVPRTNAR